MHLGFLPHLLDQYYLLALVDPFHPVDLLVLLVQLHLALQKILSHLVNLQHHLVLLALINLWLLLVLLDLVVLSHPLVLGDHLLLEIQ
jgi:hypothetical protein